MATPPLAHSTLSPLARAWPPLSRPESGKAPGPVTLAIRTMRAADPAEQAIAAIERGLRSYFAECDRERLSKLRQAIADRIEADLALLDRLDGDDEREADFTAYAADGLTTVGHSSDMEPSLCGTVVSWPSRTMYSSEEDLELDPAEAGIGDMDGAVEQYPHLYGDVR